MFWKKLRAARSPVLPKPSSQISIYTNVESIYVTPIIKYSILLITQEIFNKFSEHLFLVKRKNSQKSYLFRPYFLYKIKALWEQTCLIPPWLDPAAGGGSLVRAGRDGLWHIPPKSCPRKTRAFLLYVFRGNCLERTNNVCRDYEENQLAEHSMASPFRTHLSFVRNF